MAQTYVRRTESFLPYLDNPWGLTKMECKILISLPDMPPKEFVRTFGMALNTHRAHTASIRDRMKNGRMETACVYFDRWWQKWQATHPNAVQRAYIEMGLENMR